MTSSPQDLLTRPQLAGHPHPIHPYRIHWAASHARQIGQPNAGSSSLADCIHSLGGNNPSLRNDPVTYARFDSSHKSIPEPWILTHWVETSAGIAP